KARCFINIPVPETSEPAPPPTIHEVDDDDIWAAFDEAEGISRKPDNTNTNNTTRPKWLPQNMQPVLEELPKWSLLAEILEEIEHEILRVENTSTFAAGALMGTNTTLVMCSSVATCSLLSEFLSKVDVGRPKGEWGRKMMLQRLKSWLFWEQRRKWEKENAA
ncbi:DNA repair protein RAD16, partial [Marasmius crinis-equi]